MSVGIDARRGGGELHHVGHSERRADQGETSQDAWAKASAAHRHGLGVILCVGETDAERDAGRAARVVQAQIEKSVPDLATGAWLTLAYEPRWAIGTGRTPTLDEIAEVHSIARAKLRTLVGDAADTIRILYGGSVTGANAAAILETEDVDGALVGGASLTAAKFVPIIEAAGWGGAYTSPGEGRGPVVTLGVNKRSARQHPPRHWAPASAGEAFLSA